MSDQSAANLPFVVDYIEVIIRPWTAWAAFGDVDPGEHGVGVRSGYLEHAIEAVAPGAGTFLANRAKCVERFDQIAEGGGVSFQGHL